MKDFFDLHLALIKYAHAYSVKSDLFLGRFKNRLAFSWGRVGALDIMQRVIPNIKTRHIFNLIYFGFSDKKFLGISGR